MNRGLIEAKEEGNRHAATAELPRFMNRGLIEADHASRAARD